MPPDGKTILVTGATGTIGGLLAPRLALLRDRPRARRRIPDAVSFSGILRALARDAERTR